MCNWPAEVILIKGSNLQPLKLTRLVMAGCLLLASVISNAQLANTGWAKFRGNAQNSGLSSGSGTTSHFQFFVNLAHTAFSSPSVGLNGSLYVVSGVNLVALDSTTGVTKWTTPTASTIYASPAIGKDGTVYICDRQDIYAVDGTTGVIKWTYPVSGSIYGSPAIGNDGTVYVGELFDSISSGLLIALHSDGTVKWLAESAGVSSSPAIGLNGLIYFGADDGGVYALNASDGTVAFSFMTGGPVQAAPAIAPEGTVFVLAGDGEVYSLTSALAMNWSYATDSVVTYAPQFVSSPAIGPDGAIYVGTTTGKLLSISKVGILNWSFQTDLSYTDSPYSIQSSVAVGSDGTIYLGPADGNVYSFNPNGQVNWKVYATNTNETSPALSSNGTLYVSVSTGVVAFSSVVPSSVTVNPAQVSGGVSSVGTITLSAAAPPEGVTVALSSSDPSATVPGSVTVPGGQTSTTFTVQTVSVVTSTVATLSCSLNGVTVKTTLTVNPPTLALVGTDFSQIVGGNSGNGSVTLSGTAPAGGIVVNLSSNNGSLTVPQSVTVAAGASSTQFVYQTAGVQSMVIATLTATLGSTTKTTVMSVLPAMVTRLSFSPSSVGGPTSSTGTVMLNGNAPTGGSVVSLSSSNAAATVPASVTIPAGKSNVTFTVKTTTVSKATVCQISAKLASTTVTTPFEVDPILVSSVTLNPSTVGCGSSSVATITLNGAAPTGGSKVTLASSNSSATVPATATVAAGQTSVTFTITTGAVTTSTAVQISATLNGGTSKATLTVTPSVLQALSLTPAVAVGGNIVTGTVTLSGIAGTGGAVVTLTSSNAAAPVANSVTVPQGQSTATFSIQTVGVTKDVIGTIQASLSGITLSATLKVSPPSLISVTMNPRNISGGQGGIGVVELSGFAPTGGVVVTLTSSSAFAQVPGSVTIPAGKSSAAFLFQTRSPATMTIATISAVAGVTVTAPLYVYPAWLLRIDVSPNSVMGGVTATGTVTLIGTAPGGGMLVTLKSSSPSAVVPASVTVPAGMSTVSFKVKTIPASSSVSAVITAQSPARDGASANLTIRN